MSIKLILGVGINDANYRTSPTIGGKTVNCPIYCRWHDMLERCYSEKYHEIKPSYKDCSVIEDWKRFSGFREWFINQPYKGNYLDKDVSILGNKEYSPEACALIPAYVNGMLLGQSEYKDRELPLGVTYHKRTKRMISERSKPYLARVNYTLDSRKSVTLRTFACPLQAHKFWQEGKIQAFELVLKRYLNEPEYVRYDKVVAGIEQRIEILLSDIKAKRETHII